MVFTNYDSDRISGLLFLALVMCVLYLMLRHDEKQAEKEGTTIQCKACANRGGDYRPEFCENRACKFYSKER